MLDGAGDCYWNATLQGNRLWRCGPGTSGCGRGSVVGLCDDGTKHLGSTEGGQFVDKLSNCDLFSEDSVGRHVVILFIHKF